jgi:hypothetical protein
LSIPRGHCRDQEEIESADGMAVVAGGFAWQDLMPLDARDGGRRGSVVLEEEQAAVAVAKLTLFPLEPCSISARVGNALAWAMK